MIGGDLKVEKYRFRARPQNINFVLFPNDQSSNQISLFSAIMLLLKMTLDTDSFFFYQDLFKCGIIEGLLVSVTVMLLVQLSIHIFTRCWFYGTAYNYPDVWTCVFGSKALNFIPILLNIISYLTYVVWYCFEIHDNFSTFLRTVWPSCPSFLTNKWFLSYIINALTVVPCLFAHKFISLTWVAYIGNIAIVVAVICLIILLVRTLNEFKFHIVVDTFGKIDGEDIPYLPFTNLFSKDPSGIFYCVGSVMTAFYMHPILDMVFSEMRNPTVFRCLSSTWIVNIVSIIIYYGIGLISYFIIQVHFHDVVTVASMMKPGEPPQNSPVFKNRPYNIFSIVLGQEISDLENENVFFNFPKSHTEAIVGQIASYIVTITTNIFYTYFLATQVSSLVIERRNDDTPPLLISGIVVILFSIGINFMNDKATQFLDFIAQIAFLILVFILPSFFYLKLYRFTKPFWGIICVLLLVIGIPMSILVLYYEALKIW